MLASARTKWVLSVLAVSMAMLSIRTGRAQDAAPPPANDLPNPYRTIANYFKMPDGRIWGSTNAIDIDHDGRSVWVAERCGENSCLNRTTGQMSKLDPLLKFDPSGKLVTSFGAGIVIWPEALRPQPTTLPVFNSAKL